MTQASELIAAAKGYAQQMVAASDNAIEQAVRAAGEIRLGGIIPGKADMPEAPQFGVSLQAPQLPPVSFQSPTPVGGGPTFQDIDRVDPAQGLPTAFSKEAPKTEVPNRPSPLAEFQEQVAALDLNVSFGQVPDIAFGEAPTIGAFAAIDRPNTSIQPFTGVAPEVDFAAPTDLGARMAAWHREAAPEFITMVSGYVDAEMVKINPQYHSQLARIETQIGRYLDGGTGLKPEVEDAIYARAQAKNDLEAKRVQDAVMADTAARGFTLPSGVMVSAMARARQDAANNNAKQATDIAVAQAEMEQKNLQFAMTTSVGLRTAAMNASLAYMQNLGTLNGQALDYAKGILGAVVETYNIAARTYGLKVEMLRAQISAYDAYLKGVFADLERYKAELSAEQAKTQVDQARVQAFTAIVNTQQAKIAMYKAKVDAELGRVSMEKLKVEIFQAQVQAYGAQVQAKNAEWQGYAAAWGGESAKMAGYKAEVDAYTAKMQGYSAGISGKSAGAQAQALTNEARAKQYAAELSGYSAAVDAAGKVATTELENNRQVIVAFQAEAAAETAKLNSYIEYYKATGQIGMEQAKLDTTTMIAVAEHTQKQQALLAQLHTANATVHANLAGAAMAGMNSLAVESFTA